MPAKVTADIYGGDVVFHGKVAGIAGGTGASMAMIPAQNATGNWIKVVQRVPVRIELDPTQLAGHPLRVGLSMEATVDVAQGTGAPVLSGQLPRASSQTRVFDAPSADADRRVREIIAINLGKPVSRAAQAVLSKVAASVSR
jgi:membrane fusion protein (multidrug efflux system)